MGRIVAGMLIVTAFCALTSTAFAHKGFYLGGGFDSTTPSGDLDGKTQVTNAAGDRLGSIGKLDTGVGINLDVGYNFNPYVGVEYFTMSASHTAKHQAEPSNTDAIAVARVLGLRLTAPLGESLDAFLRVGLAAGQVSYSNYGHLGSTTAGVFTSVSNTSLDLSGTGSAYGVGFEVYAGKHIGIALGYTVFSLKFNLASIDQEASKRLSKDLNETLTSSDITVAWHF